MVCSFQMILWFSFLQKKKIQWRGIKLHKSLHKYSLLNKRHATYFMISAFIQQSCGVCNWVYKAIHLLMLSFSWVSPKALSILLLLLRSDQHLYSLSALGFNFVLDAFINEHNHWWICSSQIAKRKIVWRTLVDYHVTEDEVQAQGIKSHLTDYSRRCTFSVFISLKLDDCLSYYCFWSYILSSG